MALWGLILLLSKNYPTSSDNSDEKNNDHMNQTQMQETQHTLAFNYCVIATGCYSSFPPVTCKTSNDMSAMYNQLNKVLEDKDSKNIVIVGAGFVGVELLGEIASKYGDKKITLIDCNDSILMGRGSDNGSDINTIKVNNELRQSLLKRIKDNFPNCNMMFGEKVDITQKMQQELNENNTFYLTGKREICTDKGTKLKTDLILFTIGNKTNNRYFV